MTKAVIFDIRKLPTPGYPSCIVTLQEDLLSNVTLNHVILKLLYE